MSSTTIDLTSFHLNESLILDLTHTILASDHVFSPLIEVIIFLIYVILLTTGFIANFFIIILFLTRKRSRDSRCLFFLNLALSDAIYCLFFCPFTLHNILRKSWPFNELLCRIVPTFQGLLIFVSSGTITLISLQRTLIITGLCQSSILSIFKREPLLLALVWVFAILLSCPIFLYQTVREVGLPNVLTIPICSELWPAYGRFYYTIIVLLSQWALPLITMIICHYRIDSFLRESSKARVRLLTFNDIDSKNGGNMFYSKLVYQVINKRDIRDKLRRNTKVTRALFKNTLIFGLIWLPLNAINLYLDIFPETTLPANLIYLGQAISQIIAITSPTSNAYLYYWSNTKIRNLIKKC